MDDEASELQRKVVSGDADAGDRIRLLAIRSRLGLSPYLDLGGGRVLHLPDGALTICVGGASATVTVTRSSNSVQVATHGSAAVSMGIGDDGEIVVATYSA